MSNSILAVNIPEINTKTIEVAGRLHQIAKVTEHCWLLTDLATGEVWHFACTETMWEYIGTIKPVQDLSLPQLPARCPERSRNAHYTKLNHHGFIHLMMTRGRRIPSGEVIAIPATTTPEPTPAQQKAVAEFLNNSEAYFKQFSQMVNAKVSNYTLNKMQWGLSAYEHAAGLAASRYVQFVGMGI